MRSQQPELVARGLRSDHERETLPTSTPPEVRQGARIRLPSSLCKPSLRTYFDWDDSRNDDYSTRPTVLDLFAGAGGAALGLYQAGFRVVGVDIRNQPHYPFEFHQGDALTWPLEGFDAIWASPPCQHYTRETPPNRRHLHPDLIDDVRELLRATGKSYIIENVPDARRKLRNPIMLCGTMFGLPIYRHRYFEVHPEWFGLQISCRHEKHPVVVTGTPRRKTGSFEYKVGVCREAMQISWMTRKELDEAIPPAYSRFLGEQLMKVLNG